MVDRRADVPQASADAGRSAQVTVPGWVWIAAVLAAATLVARETVVARREVRPVRIAVVFSAAIGLIAVTVLALAADGSPFGVLGVPRRYATYQPEPGFDWRVLLPAAGVGLLAGAFIGAIRTAAGTVHDALPSARTRNRIAAALGTVLLATGVAALLLR